MLFKVIFAFEIGGAVARQKIAQDIEVEAPQIPEPRNGKGNTKIDLIPGAADHPDPFGSGSADQGIDVHRLFVGEHTAVLKAAEVLLHVLADGRGIHVAGDYEKHVLGLVPAVDVGSQAITGHGSDGVARADDEVLIGCPGEGSRLEILIKAPFGIILVALEFGNDDGLLALKFLRIERGMEGHVAYHIDAGLPVLGRHVREVAGFVKTRVGVEISAKGLHVLRQLSLGAGFRPLEDHVLENVADAELRGLLMGGARTDVKTGTDNGETGILQNIDGQPVGKAKAGFLAGGL